MAGMLAGVLGKATGVANDAGLRAASAAGNAGGIASSAMGIAAQKLPAMTDEQRAAALETAQVALLKVGDVAAGGLNAAGAAGQQKAEQVAEYLELWVKRQVHRQVGIVIDRVPGVIKDLTDDPEMPRLARRGRDRMIDAAWPDVREELLRVVAEGLDKQKDPNAEGASGPDCVRAFFRYHLFPFDKSFWGTIKDPVWVVFLLASFVPWSGMTPLVFFFVYLIIDHSDTYQLIAFILRFKGTQFISHGLLKALMGFYMFIGCVTAPAQEHEHYCEKTGPGIAGPVEIVVGGWFLQVFLIWMSFAQLRCARSKGRRATRVEVSDASRSRGGHIVKLLAYDLVCFVGCAGFLVWVLSTRPGMRHDEWVFRHAFFGTQVVYGLTSFPFFFFTLPLIQPVLTHSPPTAYDRRGRCVPIEGPPRLEDQKREPTRRMVTIEEVQALLVNMRDVTLGRITATAAAKQDETTAGIPAVSSGVVATDQGGPDAGGSARPDIV